MIQSINEENEENGKEWRFVKSEEMEDKCLMKILNIT